jgi:hypothetical protein
MNPDEIRRQVRSGALTADAALLLVEQALLESPTASVWVLRGDLIQLSETPSRPLADAADSYREAHRLDPESPEPLEALGHFFDAVIPDRAEAERCYRAAIAAGAGEGCARALKELLDGE